MRERVTLCSTTLGEDGRHEPPLGCLYIAAALEAIGIEVDLRDYQFDPGASRTSSESLAVHLRDHAPILAISCFVDMLPLVIDATRQLKNRQPKTEIILGGPGPSASAERILELYPWIDAVVLGEGEETIQEWFSQRRGERVSEPIAGMSYRQGPEIRTGPARPRRTDLGAVARPAYHLARPNEYSHVSAITTRGCAYRCSFCDVTALWGNRSVYRDIDEVIDEIIGNCDQVGKNQVTIVDDTFVQDRKRVRAFCDRLIERGSPFAWSCFGRINLMSPALLDRMAEAGCASIFYGIDSGSPAVLAKTHKMVRAEAVLPIIGHSAKVFEHVEASFIWGYPFEELDDFKMTLELAARVSELSPRVNVQLHMLSPLPNSPIYRGHGDSLQEPEPEDRPWLLLPPLLLDPQAASIGQLIRAAPDVYPGFFTLPTPAKREKRELLERVVRSLNRTIGLTLTDPRIGRLVDSEIPELERELVETPAHASDKIGAGLAVGFLRRSRQRRRVQPALERRGN